MDKVPSWESLFVSRQKGLFLSVCTWTITNWLERKHGSYVETIMKQVYLTRRECKTNAGTVEIFRNLFESRISARATENLPSGKSRENLDVVL